MPLASLVLAAALPASAPRPVAPEDVYRIASITDLEVSPDGTKLAYTIRHADKAEDGFRYELFVADAEGKNPRRVCSEDDDCTNPKFSPDGKRIAYISEDDDADQVFVAKVAGGRGRAITKGKESISEVEWSPDGSQLVVVRDDPPTRKTEDAPWVITGSQIQSDGDGFNDGRHTHLYVVGASGGTPRPLTSGPYDDASPRWSPKGDLIAFVSNRNADPEDTDDTDIWLVSAKAGSPRRLAANPGPDAGPSWSHAGDRVAFVGSLRPNDYYATTHALIAPVEGGAACDLSAALDNWVSTDDFVGGGGDSARIAWSLDDAHVVVPFDRRGANWIGMLPSAGGDPKELLAGAKVYGLVRVANATKRLYFTVATPATYSELWTANADGSGARKLVGPNDTLFAGLKLSRPEKVQARNSAGDTVDSWLYPPVDFDPTKSYPLILYIHGGPQEYDGDYWEIGLENQIFPGRGWAVLRVNYRGSTSYGEAFSHAVWADWHSREQEDLMASIDAALAGHKWLDPHRLGVGGWSYGGIMTIWLVSHTDRFKVGVPERFEVDYLSCFGTDQWHTQYKTELGLPWEAENRYRALSPGAKITSIKTPLFLIANEKDGNCPPTQAMQFYQRLKLMNMQTELVIYPDESHSMHVPSHLVDRLNRLIGWYGRYLK